MSSKEKQVADFNPDKYKVPEGTPKTAIVVGAGNRGHGYSYYAKYYPEQFKVLVWLL